MPTATSPKLNHPDTQGYIPFHHASSQKPCSTYYRLIGTLSPTPTPTDNDLAAPKTPLIILHDGGPGTTTLNHTPLLHSAILDLHTTHGIPLLFYDQLNCGRTSSPFTKKQARADKDNDNDSNGTDTDASFDASRWTMDLYIKQLDSVIRHFGLDVTGYTLLGHGWGAMVAGEWAARGPVAGLERVVLANGGVSVGLVRDGVRGLVGDVEGSVLGALAMEGEGEYEEDEEGFDEEERKKEVAKLVSEEYFRRHVCRVQPVPEGVQYTVRTPLTLAGPLKDWDLREKAHAITVEALLISGRYDEVQEAAILPWFHEIQRVKWVQFEHSSHMPHYEEWERWLAVVGSFLRNY